MYAVHAMYMGADTCASRGGAWEGCVLADQPDSRYVYQCGMPGCGWDTPADEQGYHRAQVHQSTEHEGEHGCIRGIVDADTGEVVISGFGPRVLQKAQKEGIVPVKGGGSRGGGGSAKGGKEKAETERMPSGTKPAGIGVRTKQLYRDVAIHLPTLEPLFQRCRDVFAEGWDDSDAGFSAWLHDTILESYRPHVMTLFGGDPGTVPEDAPMPTREDLAQLILDPARILDGDLPAIYAAMFEAVVWSQVAGPYQPWREQLVGGEVA